MGLYKGAMWILKVCVLYWRGLDQGAKSIKSWRRLELRQYLSPPSPLTLLVQHVSTRGVCHSFWISSGRLSSVARWLLTLCGITLANVDSASSTARDRSERVYGQGTKNIVADTETVFFHSR